MAFLAVSYASWSYLRLCFTAALAFSRAALISGFVEDVLAVLESARVELLGADQFPGSDIDANTLLGAESVIKLTTSSIVVATVFFIF